MKTRTQQTCILAAFTFSVALALPSVATAEDASATDHAKRGRTAYDLRDWPVAIKEYRSAYAAEQRPDYLFGVAQSERQSGDWAAAIASFKAYKRLESVSAQQAAAADLLVTKCEEEQAKADAATRRAAAASGAATPPSSPPTQVVAAADLSHPPMPGATGEERTVTPKAFYEDAAGDAMFVVGLGAAGVGTFFLIRGNADMRQAKFAITERLAEEAGNKAHNEQVAGAVILPLGAAVVAAALYRWVSAGHADTPKVTGWSVGPTYVGYSGEF